MKANTQYIRKICKQIETAVNRSIKGFPDAIWLSDLFKQKKIPVSASTFARIYGITPSTSKPYQSTLDNLAKFLEYENWDNYMEDQSKYHFSSNFFLTENAEGFSQSVLEMALYLKQYDTVRMMLEKYSYFENNPVHFSTANLIGKYVKLHDYDQGLLHVLADTKAGRSLFYECFVDEENDCFSNALTHYYLPEVTAAEDVFFVYSYLLAQQGYKGGIEKSLLKKYHELLNNLDSKPLHYHLLSRYFECNILIDGGENKLQNKVINYLDAISNLAFSMVNNEWLLARSSRALLHFGFKNELLTHVKFNEMVNTILMKKSQSKKSAALYSIQLYWLYSNKEDTIAYHPFHLSIDYLQGNSLERIAIESATASLYATGETKKRIEENLKQFCLDSTIQWIPNLLFG